MDDEKKKRRRGRRGGSRRPDESADPTIRQQRVEDSGDVTPPIYETVRETSDLNRRATSATSGKPDSARARTDRTDKASARKEADVSPMDFWRSGRSRSHREAATPARRGSGWWRALTSLHVPPWMPVASIIVVVFGIFGLLFFARSATGAPRIGDHWHASYQVTICGEKQPAMPSFEGGGGSPGTHGDGVIHLHPFTTSSEGSKNSLKGYFETGGGALSDSQIRSPGFSKTWRNGDKCDDGTEGTLQVFLNGEKLNDFTRYIPKDGDRLRILFGPVEAGDVVETDRTIINESLATRTLNVEVTGAESSTEISPSALQVAAQEVVRLEIQNSSDISHGLRVAGPDGEYETADDFVSIPDIIPVGETGFLIMRFDSPGTIEFRDSTAIDATGSIIVGEAEGAEPSPGANPEADSEIAIEATEDAFAPSEISATAGQTLRITISATGRFGHNIRIAGPDGEFETDDDQISNDVSPGGAVDFFVTLDDPGTYKFRCDFHTQTGGTIVVE